MQLYILSLLLLSTAGIAAALSWRVASRLRLVNEAAMFAGFMDHGPFVAFMKDTEGRYVYANRELADLMSKIRPDKTTILGHTDQELFRSAEGNLYRDHDRVVIEHGKPLQFDEVSVEADGNTRYWSTLKFPRADRRGRQCVAGISIDVTALRNARIDARSNADQVSLAVAAGRMGTLTLDLATQTLETSPVFASLHGRPETKTRLTLAESLAEVHPDDRVGIIDAVNAALSDNAPKRISYRVLLPNGSIRWIELMGRVFTDEQGTPAVVRGVGFDTTEERAAFEEVSRRGGILRRLIEVQESERQTLCHEIHDGMIQYVVGAKMLLETIASEVADATVAERVRSATNHLDRAIVEGRQIIRGVRTAVLDDLGFTAAMEDLRDQMATMNVTVELCLGEGLNSLEMPVSTTLYRVVQESLSNILKHAGTNRARVQVQRDGDNVQLRIADWGSGFIVDEGRKRGFGILGMGERVRLAGGDFWIESQPGAGSQVNARVPIQSTNMG